MTEMDMLVDDLEKQYCPPLDTATFRAILLDYDLRNSTDLQSARDILDILSSGAELEEATGFDPSGSSGLLTSSDSNGRIRTDDESEGGQGNTEWSSTTDDTSLSKGMTALDLEGLKSSDHGDDSEGNNHTEQDMGYDAQLEDVDLTTKEAVLIETFPKLKPFDIKWALSKNKGRAGPAIEELLNKAFMEETGESYRSIDAFSENELPRPRKGKGKKRRLAKSDNASNVQSIGAGVPSRWEHAKRDIEFLSSNTSMPQQQVSSIYYQHDASLKASIRAIIDAHAALKLATDDEPLIAIHAQTLHNSFPNIPFSKLLILTSLTHPSLTSATALATELTAQPADQTRTESPIQLSFRLAPSDLSSSPPKPQSHTTASMSSSSQASTYVALRNAAFDQAALAYRKSKSTPLMGGAAAYYSSVGRDLDSRVKTASAAAAETLVSQQSSRDMLDLHGVGVKDAVRITRERVTQWWVRAGAAAGGGGSHAGFRIVTGKGTHSEGRRGKLGPAVGGMLMREGWRVEVGSGVLVVRGVAPKK